MKVIAFTITILMSIVASAADWVYDNGFISDGDWKFNATVKNTTDMTVGEPVPADCPTSVTPLDFSKPVKSSDGQTTYTITVLSCNIRNVTPSVRDYVGELTLPGEGLVTINSSCFGQCANMTGELVFPSTLKRLKAAAFYKSRKITCNAACIPSGLVEMGVQVFTSTGLYGDLSLPNLVTDDMRDTFLGTKITSVYLGPSVTGLWGASGQGPFQECTELTNVVFDSECSVYFKANSVFQGCTKLKELDLRCATTFEANNGGHFDGCTSLKKITFGPKLVTLGKNTFNNATALEEIVFTGPPPTNLGLPYLQDRSPYTGLSQRTIKTTVYKANYRTPNASGLSWLDYAENGEIHSVGTTFAATNVVPSVEKRPLIAPDLVVGCNSSVAYVDGNWKVTTTVLSGEGELYVTATDADDKVVTNLVSLTAAPSATPYECVLNSLESGKVYALAMLSRVDGLWEPSASFATIFNGGVNITKITDADRGAGTIGSFKISLANDVLAAGDLAIGYELGPATDAVSGTDFCALSGTVTIHAGKNSAIVEIAPLPSGETADKTVELKITSGNYFIGQGTESLSILGSASFGGWVFNPTTQTMSNEVWQFAATLNGTDGINVGSVNGTPANGPVPTELSPLDLSNAVVGTDNKRYWIIVLGGLFKDVTALRPMVGALTLPGEGLTTIQAHAFNSCSKATGDIVFPSTLTTLGGAAFMSASKLNFDATKFPEGITSIGVQVFYYTGLYGDLYLPNLVGADYRSTFQGTKLTSIRLGPGVTGTDGGYGQGFVQGCTKLTNVVFEADSVNLWYMDVFRECTSLKELDLTMVKKLENDENNPSYQSGFFQYSGVKRITFSSKLTKLSSKVFAYANNLQEVVFTGPPPVDFREPYLYGAAQCVTTVVYKANYRMTNALGKCWLDYAADGKIGRRRTTMKSSCISVDPSLRPLIAPDVINGFIINCR